MQKEDMIPRITLNQIRSDCFKGRAIVIVGPRQVGKTTLTEKIIKSLLKEEYVFFNCNDPKDVDVLETRDLVYLKTIIGDLKVVFIDEGQRVKHIGDAVKLIVDTYKDDVQVFLTGSSSINILNFTQEPLTGRKFVYNLYPISLEEYVEYKSAKEVLRSLSDLVVYGMYPDVLSESSFGKKVQILEELASSNLYKDIFEFQKVKSPNLLYRLVKAIALQVGKEVSYNEIANLLDIDRKTVERYVDLLEKSFVIFRLYPYFTNKRNELSKLPKIYFYDNGIRNAILNNFGPLDSRQDVGSLWENFLVSERLKFRKYHGIHANQYFWRTRSGAEIDLVEDLQGRLDGYEFKWGTKKTSKEPSAWKGYKNSSFNLINPEKLKGFIL